MRGSFWLMILAVAACTPSTTLGPVAPTEQSAMQYSENEEANAFFVRAQELLTRSDPRTGGGFDNAREAIRLYQEAIRRDPNFALAYVQMARAWMNLGYSNPGAESNDDIDAQVRAAANRAIELNANLPQAHALMGQIYYLSDYNFEAADREYRWAVQNSPTDGAARAGLAAFLATMGRFEEAMQEAELAEGIRHSAADAFNRARIYYGLREYDAAVDHCRRALSMQENQATRFYLGLMLMAQGNPSEAIAELEHAASRGPNAGALLGLAYGYATVGRAEDAMRVVADLRNTHSEDRIVGYRLAAVYLALGDRDEAMRQLERDYEGRGSWMVQLKVDPVMDPLREDPRFRDLMRRMNFS